MKRFLPILILAAAGLVSACASPSEVTRNAPTGVFGMAATATEAGPGPTSAQVQDWDLAQLVVNVPQTLTVSEENRIKPRSDIVWHGDPYGNRYAQVTQVMSQPLQSTLARMDGDMPVIVRLDVTRFHAQTPRVRYTFGGEHEIEFDLTVIDATTGRVLMGPTHHDLTFRAYGGDEALAAEARGMGQRERIQGRMSQWALQEFGLLGTNEAIPDIGS